MTYISIDKSYFDEIPKTISVKGVDVKIQDESGFLFTISAMKNPGKEWKYQPKSCTYLHIQTGLKVRLHNSGTLDHYQIIGRGIAEVELEVIYP